MSSQEAEADQTAHILKLPMELLEMIADQVDTETSILNLRLTCKELSTAAFKAFSTEYFDEVTCFMADPQRLLRAKHITSAPHIARRMTFITFTLVPFEHRLNFISLAPARDQDRDSAILEMVTHNSRQTWALYGDTSKTPSAILLSLVKSIMRDVKHLPWCNVCIDSSPTTSWTARPRDLQPFSLTFPNMCLGIAQQTGCEITTLLVNDRCLLDPADFGKTGAFHHVVEGLRRIEYTACPLSEHDLTCAKRHLHNDAVRSILQNASRLEDLELVIQPSLRIVDTEKCLDLAPDLMKAVSLSSLEVLQLRGLQFRLGDFLDILNRDAIDLKHLLLENIDILHHRPPWMAVLECLKTNCKST